MVVRVPVDAAKVLVPPTLELFSATAAAVSVTPALPVVLRVSVAALVLLAVILPEPEVRNSVPAEVRELPLAASVIAPEPLALSVRSPAVVVTEAFVPKVMLPLAAVVSEEVPLEETVPLTERLEPELAVKAPVVSVPPRVIAPAEDS